MLKTVVPRQLIVPFHISLAEFAVRSIHKMEFRRFLGGRSHGKAAVFLLLWRKRPLCPSLVLLEIEMLFKYALLKFYWNFLLLLRAKDENEGSLRFPVGGL